MPNQEYPNLPLTEHPYHNVFIRLQCELAECSEEKQDVCHSMISIHDHSGDMYGDYTLRCRLCGKTETRHFADN